MRLTLILIICFFTQFSLGQSSQSTTLKTIDGNSFYCVANDTNKKLIIFLHGGVNNPYFNQSPDKISIDFLLENNSAFLEQMLNNGFNLFMPITHDNLNWVDHPKYVFTALQQIVSQSAIKYEEIYIGGFSDGGTGSYKIFYQNPNYFDGLIVFNGYPQHKNFNKTVDYKSITDKKILFISTEKDQVIPYEFLLTEYCLQKQHNPNTFLYLSSGSHSFAGYTTEDIQEISDILNSVNQNTTRQPLQGFIRNDSLVVLYPFRKKIVRKFAFGKEVYKENLKQQKQYKK